MFSWFVDYMGHACSLSLFKEVSLFVDYKSFGKGKSWFVYYKVFKDCSAFSWFISQPHAKEKLLSLFKTFLGLFILFDTPSDALLGLFIIRPFVYLRF